MAGSSTQSLARADLGEAPARVLIVCAPYYRDIADLLLAGARAEIEAWGATHETVEVPGALEIPPAVALAARLGDHHAFVALGCVIRGETTHYQTVVEESARGLTLLGLQGHCIGNAILTVENEEQALVRADPARGNKGADAAAAALHLLAFSRRLTRQEKGVGFLGRLGGAA
ncbi:6,7-dimethyl-8-ribityllumazine synthase [Rubellimicrobium thermophilum DSM 16684]|uniref:6,7-dimethyl-8-ribityllumazine synthase n=1 Tax=Rubellimicrobium thermophilum DSM 16684 TaxID=1123069 RepID=S9S7U6_9RHOB|nr:6,7-dimethyl-8-ribityllumazine synthase [Rubellimicrobium thermophilum]EPX86255.1 6,7-dimethyl-8-ribityllumazine synthase [Rubellimicrobium thermophilum DSM 16684]